MGYITKYMRLKNIGIPPELLGNDIDSEIEKKVKTLLSGNQTSHGLVVLVEKVKIDGEGEIKFDNTGITRYNVLLKAKMYIPILGEKIKTRVKDVPSNGFYVDEPIDIFVNTDSRVSKKVGDPVQIKITKVSFSKGKFMVLGREV